jgi:predicted amidophosphoribosyltransferase
MSCPTCSARCAGVCEPCWESFPRSVITAVPGGLDALRCRYAYGGAVAHLVLAAKATPAHGWLDTIGRSLPEPGHEALTNSCVVTWATGSREHRRARGYDPAERMARSYARRHGLPVAELLERQGGPQAGRTAQERAALRFDARPPRGAEVVLLVDDVVTTGVTMSRAAVALRAAGVESVIGVCFARRELNVASAMNGIRESGAARGGAV